MGAGNSKPGASTKHVFASETPIQFSQELIDSLQASSETNSTRAKSLDLHIAQRVAAELEKVQKRESDTLNALRQKLAASSEPESGSPSSSAPKGSKEAKAGKKHGSSLLELPSISPSDLIPKSSATKEEEARKSQSSAKVLEEIEKLKTTLGQRKTLREIPSEVELARQSVVGCLRLNDRRPLDCWQEVEAFKVEVRKLEAKFVGDVL